MPRPFSRAVRAMPGAVYSPFAEGAAGSAIPLHVGDTWLEPLAAARSESLRGADRPGLHRYGDTRGLAELIEALLAKLRARNAIAAERESLLVCAGATSALACVAGAVLEPDDEVLILAPFWPLIRGIVQAVGARPVEVPFYDCVHSAEDAIEALRARLGPRTVALYVSSPSNPTGRVLTRPELERLAEFARRHDLWLWSDEVYEDYVYAGEAFSPASIAPERSVTVFSFSKAYGLAGVRVGYLVGPPELVAQARKLGTHSFYCAPTPGQWAALAALREGEAWVADARSRYAEVGRRAAERLGLAPPAGSTFLFVDASSALDERGMPGLLADCYDRGVLVAPGGSSGAAYANWIRLCYTAVPPDAALSAVDRLAARLRGSLPRAGE